MTNLSLLYKISSQNIYKPTIVLYLLTLKIKNIHKYNRIIKRKIDYNDYCDKEFGLENKNFKKKFNIDLDLNIRILKYHFIASIYDETKRGKEINKLNEDDKNEYISWIKPNNPRKKFNYVNFDKIVDKIELLNEFE